MLQKKIKEVVTPTEEEKIKLFNILNNYAIKTGYNLNPDIDFTMDLIEGLLINKSRYGYMSCPCRLSSEDKIKDKDIFCPCKYRDADLEEYNTCFCCLYVTKKAIDDKIKLKSIPERRNTI